MKTFKIPKTWGAFFLAFLFVFPLMGKDATVSKSYNKQFDVNENATLKLKNKFGKIHITTDGGSNISIDVQVEVTAGNEEIAQKILDRITVEFSGGKDLVSAVTEIASKNNKNKSNYQINYTVKMPRTNNLEVDCQFGDLFVNELAGKMSFDIGYGNVSLGKLLHDQNELELEFGKGEIDFIKGGDLEIRHSKFQIESAEKLQMDAQFSTIGIDEVKKMDLDSRYDSFEIGKVDSLDQDSQFSQLKIEEIGSSLNMENSYGGVKIGQVSKTFSTANIDNKFAPIKIGFEEGAAFSINVDLQFANFEYPDSWSVKKTKSNNTSGSFTGENQSGGTSAVNIDSQYGDVKLK